MIRGFWFFWWLLVCVDMIVIYRSGRAFSG